MYKLFKEASLLTLVALLLSACGGSLNEGNTDVALDGPVPSREWQLVWSDEFEGTELDPANWEIQIGDGKAYGLSKWGNEEDQYYTDSPDNIRVEDGNMVITSLGDGVPMSEVDPEYGNPNVDYDFTSARVTTSERFEFTYGRVEAKIKIQTVDGLWQAFWLLGSNSSPYGTWPQKGEIDIMETYSPGSQIVGGAAHFGSSFPLNQYVSQNAVGDYDDGDYHLYSVEWDAEEIRWFFDGKHFFTLAQKSYWNYYEDPVNGWMGYVDKNGDDIDDNLEINKYLEYNVATVNAPFDQDQYIILNTAVNGNLPNGAGKFADTSLSYLGEMLVDYVRVYQCPADPFIPAEGVACKTYLDRQVDDPYYTNPSLKRNILKEISSFAAMNDFYVDGPGVVSILGNELKLTKSETATITEVSDPANPSNKYLLFESIGINAGVVPKFSIERVDGESTILAGLSGYPKASGDFKFDLYIESYDQDATVTLLGVGMADSSGREKFAALNLADYSVGEWYRVIVPISDILSGSGDSSIEEKELIELVRFKTNVAAEIRIDNLQFACGGLACGFIDDVPVFIDTIAPLWTRGIRGNDSQQDSNLLNNADYAVNDQFHVQWEIIDTGEEGHDNVIQTTIGPDITTDASNFPSSAVNFIGSENAISAIAALKEGEFRFDIRMIDNPNNVDLYFKVDGAFSSTGEQPLTLSTDVGDWVTYRCSIKNLQLQGLDVSTITAPFVMVPGINGSGKDVVFQWDNVEFSPVKEGESATLKTPILFNEGGFCLPVSPFSGGSFALVVNPDPVGHASDGVVDIPEVGDEDDNALVAKTTKTNYGVDFGGITLNLEENISFDDTGAGKIIELKAFTLRDPDVDYINPDNSSAPVRALGNMNVTFKLEGIEGRADAERTFTLTSQAEWEDITLDFNGEAAGEFNGITMIIDIGFNAQGTPNDWSLYFDNIIQVDATTTVASLADDINDNPTTYTFDDLDNFSYPTPSGFNGARGAIGIDPEGVNGQVGRVVYDYAQLSSPPLEQVVKGVTFIGGANGFPEKIPFAPSDTENNARTIVEIDVHTGRIGAEVIMKVEDAQDSFRNADVTQITTTTGWETLSFDFGTVGIEAGESFEKMLLIFEPDRCVYNDEFDPNCENLPGDDVYYFDNLTVPGAVSNPD